MRLGLDSLPRRLVVRDTHRASCVEGESMSVESVDGAAGAELRWTTRWRKRISELVMLRGSKSKRDVGPLLLRPLTPTPVTDQHAIYSSELVALLRNRKRRKNVWNIALTGGYGSGKSSILAAVRDRLQRRVVEVSLSSLSDIGVQADASDEETNNLIQKEIVKQLLYRERPSKVPGSRFHRISRLPFWRAVGVSILVGGIVAGLFWLTGWGVPLQLPTGRGSERIWLLVGIGAGTSVLALLLQALLHNRVRIDKLGTASTSISLKTDGSDAEDSFFDKYLDEIVYFFEMTRRNIVIVEDLDRFENPAIYASLRALNTVLNTSRQLRRRPMHFIYAVRDSIFEDLTNAKPPTTEPADNDEPAISTESDKSGVWQADRALSGPPTQRTKFFDLVIPIVPFITYRTSRDLLVKAMESVDSSVTADALSIVAKHITDMRLLLNIINEYRVFRARVLTPNKLQGLTASGLFAMMAFKNTRLADFELVRVGDSTLDRLYRATRDIIDGGLTDVTAEIAALEEKREPVAETRARAEQLGAELQTLTARWLPRVDKAAQNIQFRTNNQVRTTTEIATPAFWESVVDEQVEIEVLASSQIAFHIDAAGLRAELGKTVPERWAAQDNAAHRSELQRLRGQQQWLRSADFRQLTEPMRPLQRAGKPIDFRKDFLDPLSDPLLIDLLAGGYIDRNFHLYTSEFHGEVTSANAMNFLVQHVQAETPSYRYELTPEEVLAVLREGGPEVFGSIGLFNVAIYDELLRSEDVRLDRNIKLLNWVRPSGIEFLDIYATEGKHKEELFRRLSPHWPGIFEHIAMRAKDASDGLEALTLAAFEGADPDQEYPANDLIREQIATGYEKLRELTADDNDPSRAIKILQRLGVRLPSLRELSPTAIAGMIAARQYVITAESIRTALGESDSIGLDVVLSTGEVVFDHVIAHFEEYLSALDSTTPPQPSLKDIGVLVEIMSAVEQAEAGKSIEILMRMPEGNRVDDLDGVPDNVKEVLARGQRFSLTLRNVNAYISALSIDEPLARFLEAERAIDAAGAESTEQETLASQLLNEKQLTVEARLLLAKSLTAAPIAINKISAREPELIQSLVEEGLIEDDPSTFAALNRPEAQVAYIVGSKEAPTYFAQLSPSSAVLEQLIRSENVGDEIKNQIALGLPQMPQNATPEVLEALVSWSLDISTPLPPETIQAVQSSGVRTSAKIEALAIAAPTLPASEVLSYVQLLPDPYPAVLERSTKPVDLPLAPNMDNVLTIIEANGSGPVSSWDQVGEVLRVWMRHPPKD